MKRKTLFLLLLMVLIAGTTAHAAAQITIPSLDFNLSPAEGPEEVANSVQLLILLTILALAPSILIMMTAFTRFIIVFSFIRRALSLQGTPPNQVLIGLALFLTFFVMAPTFGAIMDDAYTPFMEGQIDQETFLEEASEPLKDFMLRQVRTKDLKLFADLAGIEDLTDPDALSLTVVIPSFILSELKLGFEIGFLLFIPFVVIDMIVASTLMALGMMMLPPVMISLPCKVLLFIMVDGWHLIVEKLVMTVR